MVAQVEQPKSKGLLQKLASPAFLKHKQEYVVWSKQLLQRAKNQLKLKD
ncbi:MAG TPA: hypothetical protein VHD60_02715 [Candidatus Saccharimonadales bacterium]|nr:hypothetical protein [Candidatus Saccharimonadales bacterium]